MDDLADRLNQIMAQRDLKASEVADEAGITRPVMSRYLANRSGISAENLIKLSQYLNVSPDWLLNGTDTPESIKMSKDISVDKNEIIALQKKIIKDLEKKVKEKGQDKAFKPSATVIELEFATEQDKEDYLRSKAKADLAIAKNKNTLRIKTTRKRKK